MRVSHGDVRLCFTRFQLIGGKVCQSLDAYDGPVNVAEASRTEGCVLHEKRLVFSREFES